MCEKVRRSRRSRSRSPAPRILNEYSPASDGANCTPAGSHSPKLFYSPFSDGWNCSPALCTPLCRSQFFVLEEDEDCLGEDSQCTHPLTDSFSLGVPATRFQYEPKERSLLNTEWSARSYSLHNLPGLPPAQQGGSGTVLGMMRGEDCEPGMMHGEDSEPRVFQQTGRGFQLACALESRFSWKAERASNSSACCQ